MRRNGFKLTFHAYSGCSPEPEVYGTRAEAREECARTLRRARRNGNPVVVLGPGRYEIEEREDAGMVGDDTGTLEIEGPESFPCGNCGSSHVPDDVPERTYPRGSSRWDSFCSPCCAASYAGEECDCASCEEWRAEESLRADETEGAENAQG